MNLDRIHNFYFIGIGGIGMSALARYFISIGKRVAGYDRTKTTLTAELSGSGLDIHYSDDTGAIPGEFLDPADTLIVYTPAVPSNHNELQYFRSNGFKICKRAEVLGFVTKGKRAICVAGTHGKTTVTTMITWLMNQSKTGCKAFLGGISKNFNSNFVNSGSSEFVVAEADEYDRSFLRLHPEIAVITAIDADHLDIYGSGEELSKSFEAFISQIQNGGRLVIKHGIKPELRNPDIDIYTYALKDQADFHARNIRLIKGRYFFDVITPVEIIKDLSLAHPGLINIENAVAAVAVATLAGLNRESIKKALPEFLGIKRRFDFVYQTSERVYIDDYAHHPREIDAVISSIRVLFPGKKILGIFQPHLYTRTRDFADEFAESLGELDALMLMDIYPARELPIEGVTSDIIFRQVKLGDKVIIRKENLLQALEKKNIEVLITMGAGDIDIFCEPIKQLLIKKYGI